ncbi:MAG: HYR domain-containing protein [Verrucomicrobia bacterium]|nr:HYR domain-containing protein [Verrucomicrobiota bacterium]
MNHTRPASRRATREIGGRFPWLVALALLAAPLPATQLPVSKSFFPGKSLPCPASACVSLDGVPTSYGGTPGPIQMRDVSIRWSGDTQQAMPAPLLGATVWQQWTGTLEAEVSEDSGTSWLRCAGSCELVQRISHSADAGGIEQYNTITRLTGTMAVGPRWLAWRTRDDQPNAGQTTMLAVPGGYMIDSFFDIFTEVSVDGGGSWQVADMPSRLGVKVDHRPKLPVIAPGVMLPGLCDQYAMKPNSTVTVPGGIVIRNARHKLFGAAIAPPAPGGTSVLTFGSQLDCEISTNNGTSFVPVRAPATTQVQLSRLTLGSQLLYEAEITQLGVSGGDLPLGVMIRESPTLRSGGLTSMEWDPEGYRVSSFFDIFLEVSTNGGGSWTPAGNGPALMQATSPAPQVASATTNLPPSSGRHVAVPGMTTTFANGVMLRNLVQDNFAGSVVPPAPGMGPVIGNFSATATLEVSLDGSNSFTPASGTASCFLNVANLQNDGGMCYYQTEMSGMSMRLDMSAGMPIMIRESPTRASSGRTSLRPVPGGYMIDSFFDIWVEISLDGGMSWSAAISGPLTLALQPAAPPVLVIQAPVNMNLPADGPGGRVVTFTAVATGGCTPLSVTCMPPSGRLFPPGTTSVLCTATDACGQTANASFQITIAPYQAPEWYFASKKMPPPDGLEIPGRAGMQLFPNGVAIRNLRHRQFSEGVAPPVLGASVSHSFSSQVAMDVSLDGGATWQSVSAPATCGITLEHVADVGSVEDYSLEVTHWVVSGGSLPVGVMIRESPTRASNGSTTARSTGGGFMISSFFDIFTEVSTDAGLSWAPSLTPDSIWVYPDPALHTLSPVLASQVPAPDDQWVATGDPVMQAASGFAVHSLSIRDLDHSVAPPAAGASATLTFNAVADLSWDFGVGPFVNGRAPVSCTMNVTRLDSALDAICEAEITSLNLAGGELPIGVMIRESPTKASRGMAKVIGGGGGGGVQSFFDIWVEISIDGGLSWSSATDEPMHLASREIAVAHAFSQASLTPQSGDYVSPSGGRASFPSGVVIRNVRARSFDSVLPPPPPGTMVVQACNGWADMEISTDSGESFQRYYGALAATLRTTAGLSVGSTSYFDTGILQFDILGGSLPVGVMIRESPTRASGGRTSIRANGTDNDCDSFFDIFLEVSTDGGATWTVTDSGPLTLLLQPENCPPLTINCPPNLTVRATSPAGAVVIYPVATTEGGSPPTWVATKWPSGSTFPVGTTTVSLFAGDMCGQTAEGSFQVTVLRPFERHFYAAELMPPSNSMWSLPPGGQISYANGVVVRNLAWRGFTASVQPPATAGLDLSHSFGSQVEMEISMDGGLTWVSCVASANLQFSAVNNGADGDDTLYGMELVQIDISGGTLPAGIQVRESPTKASRGETRSEAVPGGYLIDSFFDIFTEVSTDGGLTWSESASAAEIGVKVDPASVTPVAAPRSVFPMPNGQYVMPPSGRQSYACGIMLRELKLRQFTQWMEPPLLGSSQTQTFDSQLDFQLSLDGGATWTVARAPAVMTVQLSHVRQLMPDDDCDTVVTQLDVAGGDLPLGVMIRESPTRASGGGTTVSTMGGGYLISSFFDIFTEVSTDGGQTWGAATNGPAHLELERTAPAYEYTNNLMPPPHGRYVSLPASQAAFANAMIFKNVVLRQFSASITPPLPGWSTSHTFGSQVEMDVSTDNGLTSNPVAASATIGMQITARLGDDGVTVYHDTEMATLSISGGGLPANVQIRESPTRASYGRTTQSSRIGGGYAIDSFFDIFTEVSTDGGLSWLSTLSGPMSIQLSAPPPPLEVSAPPGQWALATSPAGAVVSYPAPTSTGGLPPITVTTIPPSGAIFPIGTSTVTCWATDGVGQTASDTFRVTVLPPGNPPEQYYTSNSFPAYPALYLSTEQWLALYANGIIIRNLVARDCLPAWPPPAPGTSSEWGWNPTVTLELSLDGGATFAPYRAHGTCLTRTTGPPVGSSSLSFDTEMLKFSLTGGTLPPWVMIRESPTLPSLGRNAVRALGDGFMISSFFDIFTEVSIDGGRTWSPSQSYGVLESRIDNIWYPPIPAPSPLLPPPDDRLTQDGDGWFARYANGVALKGMRISRPNASVLPPFWGVPATHNFGAQLDLLYSLNNGATFSHARANLTATLLMTRISSGLTDRVDGEFRSLSASGGDLPAGMLIRESPTEPSRGEFFLESAPDGTYRISSFFDIFVEVSMDGGLTWLPSMTLAPGRLALAAGADAEEYASNLLPQATALYAGAPGAEIVYANGLVVRDLVRRNYTQSFPPPPISGAPVVNTHGCIVDLWISLDGGVHFVPCQAPVTATEQTADLTNSGLARYFDTEMLQLDISGGNLPAGIMIRESPLKASTGRTTERNDPINPTYHIDSFFDIFTEVSTDGGMTWWPSTNGPLTMTMRTATASEAWRLRNFGTTLNGGDADDMADPDHDGQPNILEFATHTDPLHSNPPPATASLSGGHLKFTYPRAKEAMGEVTMVVEWSTTLEEGSWLSGAGETILSDDGQAQLIEASIPDVPGGRCFVRLRVQR